MRFTKAFTVPFISAMGRGAISWKDNLFRATKFESRKQSEEPESTKPSKVNEMNREWRAVCSDFETVADAAPRCRVGSPVCLTQLILGGARGLLILFLGVQIRQGDPPNVRHGLQRW